MSGITGLGTSYNLPNYTGPLIQLTPSDTPLFSAIGGLTGGKQSTDTEFEWETFDLRSAAQPAVLEGQDAPTAQERVRGTAKNLVQIHQESVSVSYTKLAAIGRKSGLNNNETNPVTDELFWQSTQMLKQMKRDVEYSFINGSYQLPTDNTTARKTRGLFEAISTNSIDVGVAGVAATFTDSGDVVGASGHGMANGDSVVFNTVVTTTGISTATPYYVVNKATNTFQVSATRGGSAIALTTNGTGTYTTLAALTLTTLHDVCQLAYDNGGLAEGETATILVNSSQKRRLTNILATAYGQYEETSRNVGGVNVKQIETDFGTLNVMLDRYVPQHKIAVVSLEELAPVFLEIPGKGHFFAEPLAKTGAQEKVHFYGEIGLKVGDERKHGEILNVSLV